MDELSDLIGKRYFLLQRYLWAIKNPADYDLDCVAKDYFLCVQKWNAKLRTMRNKARLLIGERRALQFLDYSDDNRPNNPTSLHYIFVNAHNAVTVARADKDRIEFASRVVERLNFTCSQFLEEFTTEFLRRAEKVQLLEIPRDKQSKSQLS